MKPTRKLLALIAAASEYANSKRGLREFAGRLDDPERMELLDKFRSSQWKLESAASKFISTEYRKEKPSNG